MDRRRFLATSFAASSAALASPRILAGIGQSRDLRLTLHPDELGNPVAPDFTGLSYETSQLSDPVFFSPENAALAAFYQRLGASGILRIGGNTSEFSVWTPDAAQETRKANAEQPVPSASREASAAKAEAIGPDTGHGPQVHRPVTPLAIDNLRGFLDRSGWRLIYGLNMGSESPETVADEAAYVANVMGDKLVAFQLCNEPDLFHRNGLRGRDYDYQQFATEWRRFFLAVRQRVPRAPFGGPDTANNTEWLTRFADEQRHDVAFLSQHYYAEGPPADPSMTLERLLTSDPKLQAAFAAGAAARKQTGLSFRMAETNSCYGGGKAEVSNTFAAALWAADLMYQLAQTGAIGVNFHGGGYGWYTPVAGTRADGFAARPIYYGMLLFATAGAGHLVRTDTDGADSGLPLATYGLKSREGTLKVIALNKSLDTDVTLAIDARGARKGSVMRLAASRASDTTGITFGGSTVGKDGSWTPAPPETVTARRGVLTLAVPKASGALLTLSG
jgi:hypothetical protein